MLDRTGVPVLGMRAGSQDDLAGFITVMGQVAGNDARATYLLRRQEQVMRKLEVHSVAALVRLFADLSGA